MGGEAVRRSGKPGHIRLGWLGGEKEGLGIREGEG